jgi:acetyl-CoA carboxylase biotin carboxyl carrier protein
MDWDQTLERVRRAAEFCAEAGLVRFRVEEDGLEIEVRRVARPVRPQALETVDFAAAQGGAPATNGAVAHDEPPQAVLKAEFVGIVRLSRPAVTEGTILTEDRELAYVESLGIRNPIRSNGAGRVAAVYVNDGEPVEFGQPLFAIEEV